MYTDPVLVQKPVEQPEARVQDQGELPRVSRGGIDEAVITTDAAGRVTFLNSLAESLTGWTCREAMGQPWAAVLRIVNEESQRRLERAVVDARAVATSEMRYRRLFETAQDAILILDADTGTIFDANPFLVELLGYSRDELMGKELWEIGLFQDREANRAAMQQLQAQGYIRYEDLPLQTKNGQRKDVEFVSNVY